MDQTLPPRLPAHLEPAVQRVRMAARDAAEQTVDSLGLAALASHNMVQRDALLGAQYELNRKLAIFALTFNEALDTDVARQTGALTPTQSPVKACPSPDDLVASWDKLSLVDDHEMEIHLSADRFALEIGHTCEWEIRELDAYMGSLLGMTGASGERNPLRAEVIGQCMVRAIEAVADRPEVRKVLCTEIGRSLSQAMRKTYADIVTGLRQSGVKPMGLTVRHTASRSPSQLGALNSSPGALSGTADHNAAWQNAQATGRHSGHAGGYASDHHHQLAADGRLSTRPGHLQDSRGGLATGQRVTASLGRVDGEMMALIRRLAHNASDLQEAADSHGHVTNVLRGAPVGEEAWSNYSGHSADGQPMAAPNLILAYRDELRQASHGALDHMVIDVIASLFDQILSDGKVPPQIARQIARLQLPVLRAALGDNSFFSSRKHPVRRFINRMASLGTAVDDFEGTEGRALLARVAMLVQAVVDGDFEQIGLYEQQLDALETFIAQQAQAQLQQLGQADVLLARKETEQRVAHQFAQELEAALKRVPVPDYLREFLTTTWSRVIASAEVLGEPGAALAVALRDTGRELLMSVQPKGTPALRQVFLRRLPQLMKDLNQGLDRIGCADEVRRAFFAELLPAHAESLKGQPLSTLQTNLLACEVDAALATPVPAAAGLPPLSPAQAAALPVSFSPAEAQAVGLMDERSVDWSAPLDIYLGVEPELSSVDIDIAGLPAPEPVEPTRGRSLADHVQLGFAYQMHLNGQWTKVRLTHVSANRSFFMFTHGPGQRLTVSLTSRMLVKLCDAGRLRAFENAYLLERATARARRQLAALRPH